IDGRGQPKDSNLFPALLKFSSESVLGLITRQQDRIPAILDPIPQMMQDAAGLAHPGCRNHHERPLALVQLLRFVYVTNVGKAGEPERVLVISQIRVGLFIEAFRMGAKDFRYVDGKRTIDKDRDR